MCILVIDATQAPNSVSDSALYKSYSAATEGYNVDNLHDQVDLDLVGWRQLSSLTRIMPDVMKLLVLCYVLPIESTKDTSNSVEICPGSQWNESLHLEATEKLNLHDPLGLENLFSHVDPTNFSSLSSINKLYVRPTSLLVRRSVIRPDENYVNISDLQSKYQSCSLLKRPREKQVVKKLHKVRRDQKEMRGKKSSRHQGLWKALERSEVIVGGINMKSPENVSLFGWLTSIFIGDSEMIV